MAIERRLTELVGAVGGKLHTGRSRNDQVATDLALYVRERSAAAVELVAALMERILDLAEAHRRLADARATHTSSAPSRCTSAITCSPTSGCSTATPSASPRRVPGRGGDAARARARSPGISWELDREAMAERAGVRPAGAELDRRGRQPRLRARLPVRGRRSARPTSRAWGPRSSSGRARSSASASRPTTSPRARASCRRRRTPTPRSCCGRRRRGSSASLTTARRRPARAAARLLQGPPGGQGGRSSTPSTRSSSALAGRRAGCSPGCASTASGWPRRQRDEMLAATEVADLLVRRGMPFREAHGVVGGLVRDALERGRGALRARPRPISPRTPSCSTTSTTRSSRGRLGSSRSCSDAAAPSARAWPTQLDRAREALGARARREPSRARPGRAPRERLLRALGARVARELIGCSLLASTASAARSSRPRATSATTPPATPTSA